MGTTSMPLDELITTDLFNPDTEYSSEYSQDTIDSIGTETSMDVVFNYYKSGLISRLSHLEDHDIIDTDCEVHPGDPVFITGKTRKLRGLSISGTAATVRRFDPDSMCYELDTEAGTVLVRAKHFTKWDILNGVTTTPVRDSDTEESAQDSPTDCTEYSYSHRKVPIAFDPNATMEPDLPGKPVGSDLKDE